MSRRANMLFALVLAPVLALVSSGSALAEEAQRWAINMPKGVTPVSNAIYDIHMIIFWICVVICVGVFGVMFYSMYAHRKSRGAVAANFHENTTAEVVWTIIPALILVVMAIPATTTLINIYDTADAEIDIKITGSQWKWQYEYLGEDVTFLSDLATPESEIYNTAPKGQYYLQEVSQPLVIPVKTKVRFLITAKDVIHSWWVPDFGVKKDAIPGFVNETWAYVEEPGIYRGECTELCGKDHGFMPVVAKIVSKEDFKYSEIVSVLNDDNTRICVDIERAFLRTLDAGCSSPVGALAEVKDGKLFFKGAVLSVDGKQRVDIQEEIELRNANETLGAEFAKKVINEGAADLLNGN